MISILTVNYHSSADVGVLAESLRKHPSRGPMQLVVTNNSPDDSIGLVGDERLSIDIADSVNRGFAAGINLAFQRSQGQYVMIANPDVQVTAGAMDAAIDLLVADRTTGVVLPLMRNIDGQVQRSARQFYTWPVALFARSPLRWLGIRPAFFRRYLCEDLPLDVPTTVDWGLGGAMFLRREDCESDGVFDERFFLYFEDVDLCYRTWLRGQRVMYCPRIECIHAHRRSSRNPFTLAGWHHLRSFLAFRKKYGGLPQRPVPQTT
ncbi:MAG TPA: glycosyltransferase family 2 protein [Phycisphaerae bacterium]|nr:glycosyltransferase family 2 protein [Phycisphaerae bacterium]